MEATERLGGIHLPRKAKAREPQKKVTKVDVYKELSRRYGWTVTDIANMTPYQQLAYLHGDPDGDSSVITFRSEKEYEEWLQTTQQSR